MVMGILGQNDLHREADVSATTACIMRPTALFLLLQLVVLAVLSNTDRLGKCVVVTIFLKIQQHFSIILLVLFA